MPSPFEMEPSPYHLGTCNARVVDATGAFAPCGKPAVYRTLGSSATELAGDARRCEAHAPSAVLDRGADEAYPRGRGWSQTETETPGAERSE